MIVASPVPEFAVTFTLVPVVAPNVTFSLLVHSMSASLFVSASKVYDSPYLSVSVLFVNSSVTSALFNVIVISALLPK